LNSFGTSNKVSEAFARFLKPVKSYSPTPGFSIVLNPFHLFSFEKVPSFIGLFYILSASLIY
jgi:hypothetical protein